MSLHGEIVATIYLVVSSILLQDLFYFSVGFLLEYYKMDKVKLKQYNLKMNEKLMELQSKFNAENQHILKHLCTS